MAKALLKTTRVETTYSGEFAEPLAVDFPKWGVQVKLGYWSVRCFNFEDSTDTSRSVELRLISHREPWEPRSSFVVCYSSLAVEDNRYSRFPLEKQLLAKFPLADAPELPLGLIEEALGFSLLEAIGA